MAHHGVKPKLKSISGGLSGVPPMPSMLPQSMEQDWTIVATDLRDRRLLTTAMLGTLETYIRALWSARLAQEAIETHGLIVKTERGSPKANPATTLLSDSSTTIARLAAELGVTPASRSRTSMLADEPQDDDALGL